MDNTSISMDNTSISMDKTSIINGQYVHKKAPSREAVKRSSIVS